jgi:WD40 repeat protein
LYTLEGYGSYWALSKKGFPASGNPKHRRVDSSHALITAVEWLSSDVIAAGLKDSTIFLHDIRSGGSAARLQHPHAVTKIRNIDPYRIVVAGINSVSSITLFGTIIITNTPSSKCTISGTHQTVSNEIPTQTINTTLPPDPTSASSTTRQNLSRTST